MQSMMMAAKLPARFQEQVVIQRGYQDDTKELWSEIWNTLMGYINADDSPDKLQQKDTLVDLMSQFLSHVAHDSKFYLPCTPNVLRASFGQANFQPLSAAQAFEALHEYAIRILAQPWRAEFTKINMYSGYYVHTVQSRLLEAHRLLEEMGFHVDPSSQTATLREPVDVDQVTKAAIDTLMASVECRIIERILESLPAGAYTPQGVLCYRASYVGGVEAAVHHLNVTLRQRNFQRYFAPPAEAGGGGGGGGVGAGGPAPAYPWQPAPPAAPTALPPVPTARLVDVGDRDTRENNQVWIPKTIRHNRSERAEPPRAPAASALLPATLDEHHLASWDLVDDATGAGAGAVPPAAQSRQPLPGDSLDDSWGYVLNSLDRRRPASGRYDNVPEPAAPAVTGTAASTQRGGGSQRSATFPTPRAEPRAPPRGRGGGYGAADQRQAYDSRPQQPQHSPHSQHPQLAPLPNGSARLPASDPRNGAVPEPALRQQQQPAGPGRASSAAVEYSPPRPPPPAEHAAPQRPPTYEYTDSVRSGAMAEHNPAARGSLADDYGAGMRTNVMEHNPAARASLPSDYHQAAHQTQHQTHHQTQHQPQHQAQHQAQNQAHHQAQHQAPHQAQHQAQHQAPHQAPHQSPYQPQHQSQHQAPHQSPYQPQHQPQHQASHQVHQGTHQPPHPHSLPNDLQPTPRPSLVNDNLVPRSSSLVNDHSKAPRPSGNDRNFGPRSVPPAEGRGNGNGIGGNGYGSDNSGRRSSGHRPSPRPEPSPEPAPAPAPAARPRASPSEPRRPELGAWPTRPEPEPAPASPSAEEQWSCHACTYLNPVSVRVCGMCGKSRQVVGRPAPAPPVAVAPVDPPDDLACPQCTLLNSRKARKCGACEADLRPAEKLAL